MEFYDVVSRRRTVREFSTDYPPTLADPIGLSRRDGPKPVPAEAVKRALAAGLQAPCNAHLKSWRFILLRDREARRRAVADGLKARDMKDREEIESFVARFAEEELKKVYRRSLPLQLTMMLEAPELLLVCYKMKPLAQCRTLFELNPLASVWMCIENIMLALAAEGLFGCTYTPYDAAGLKEFLAVPPEYEIAAVIPFGFPKQQPQPAAAESLEGRLFIDRWGKRSV